MRVPKTVGVFSHRHIGDTLFVQPIVAYLKENHFRVILFVKSSSARTLATFFETEPDSVVVLTDRLWADSQVVSREKLDAALLLNFSFHSALLTFLNRVPSFGANTEGRRFLIHRGFSPMHFSLPFNIPQCKPLNFPKSSKGKRQHSIAYHYKTLLLFCKKYEGHGKLSPVIPRVPRLKSCEKNGEYILFQVGTTRESKKIPDEIVQSLIDEVKKITLNSVYLCGDDAQSAKSIQGVDQNWVGKTSLEEYIALIAGAKALFSPDTSAIHIASAFGVKIFGFYGSTDPLEYGPLSEDAYINGVEMACMPCYKKKCIYRQEDPLFMGCLKRIDKSAYIRELRAFIASHPL